MVDNLEETEWRPQNTEEEQEEGENDGMDGR